MTTRATGTFEVKVTPQPAESGGQYGVPGRMLLDKQLYGDLEGVSQGQMLAAGTAVKGSAGYVAMELVTGTLQGRRGSFILQHSGTMNRGVPEMAISVVPDSGTEELTGIRGRFTILIADGKHSYEFEYEIGEGA
ncbi:DUF3224 domain-containing protein [Paracidobacterium acidisoli]|uniref:DUF3224 domain-containing protein n=1 Tax=Paracidobacterium acidisoli TaxID=2303751 RepID=A0A372IUL6_9BACT|nr:DUF3224 domain-containing protein [Paracidobacterium acidisoli]MBT9330078.1 DUF3224 domain-containing protein [Paracidobacterium acidisoli]